jgi:hypothetical protein
MHEGGFVFLVFLSRSGPQFDRSLPMQEQSGWTEHAAFTDDLVDAGFFIMGGPLADNHRVVIVVNADTEDQIRSTLARDPWNETHVRIDGIEEWSIKFDGRSPQ